MQRATVVIRVVVEAEDRGEAIEAGRLIVKTIEDHYLGDFLVGACVDSAVLR